MLKDSDRGDILELRKKLLELNTEFFSFCLRRKKITLQIQKSKKRTQKYSYYDPAQEKKVFQNFQEQFSQLNLRELLAFSLMMEEHAMGGNSIGDTDHYPAWSLGQHLHLKSGELYEMINPLLLKLFCPEEFKLLVLRDEFSYLSDF